MATVVYEVDVGDAVELFAYVHGERVSATWVDFASMHDSAGIAVGDGGDCPRYTVDGGGLFECHGFVKWDGCAEWHIYAHTCGAEGMKRLAMMLGFAMVEACAVMGEFYGTAGPPDLEDEIESLDLPKSYRRVVVG